MVLLVITIAAIFYGISRRGHLTFSPDGGFSFGFIEKGNTETSDNTAAFTNLQVQLSQDDIQIEQGKSFGWKYVGPETSVPSVSVDHDTLVVGRGTEEGKASSRSGGTLTVTIPSGHWDLGEVSLSTENGDISFAPDAKAAAQSVQLTSGNGDISLSDCSGTTIDTSTSNGDIQLESVSFDTFDLRSDNGDISISLADSLDNYTITPSTAMGDISIGDNSYSENNKVSVGAGKKTIEAVTGMGDIAIDD